MREERSESPPSERQPEIREDGSESPMSERRPEVQEDGSESPPSERKPAHKQRRLRFSSDEDESDGPAVEEQNEDANDDSQNLANIDLSESDEDAEGSGQVGFWF